MHIVHIVPGSGGRFYCENCLRDISLLKEFKKMGHKITIIPLYLPYFLNPLLPLEHLDQESSPVFYGAINLYLNQIFPGYRKFPAWIKKILDAPFFLKQAANQAGSTRAAGLNELTLSMLKGEHGDQSAELGQIIQWLKEQDKPDVLHISNVLLSGMAQALRNELKVPVVCSLQDEDTWIQSMDRPSEKAAWHLIGENDSFIDQYIAPSVYYKKYITDQLAIDPQKIGVIYNGINPQEYSPVTNLPGKPVIGYLSRLTPDQGLDFLVEAFIALKQVRGMDNLELHITGGYTNDDKYFIKQIKKEIRSHNLSESVKFIKNFDHKHRKQFLKNITLLSVPVPNRGAFGLFQIEAFASGRGVIEPAQGAFAEIIKKTDAGVMYVPANIYSFVKQVSSLLSDKSRLEEMSKNALNAASQYFDIHITAEQTLELYKKLLDNTIKD